jgi:hypothetical protein
MHALNIVQQLLRSCCPGIHAARLTVILAVVAAAVRSRRLTLTELGRALISPAHVKHSIKRVDRLLGNPHLGGERFEVYQALARRLVGVQREPVIVIDWSDLTADRRWQLLRAAMPRGGRALTVYEEIHPLRHLANPRVHRAFLARLKALLPDGVKPILLTDAGFRAPWFKSVNRLGWHWIGRIRNRDYLCPESGHASSDRSFQPRRLPSLSHQASQETSHPQICLRATRALEPEPEAGPRPARTLVACRLPLARASARHPNHQPLRRTHADRRGLPRLEMHALRLGLRTQPLALPGALGRVATDRAAQLLRLVADRPTGARPRTPIPLPKQHPPLAPRALRFQPRLPHRAACRRSTARLQSAPPPATHSSTATPPQRAMICGETSGTDPFDSDSDE